MPIPKPHSHTLRLLFFWSGITATLAYRAIIVMTGVNDAALKIVWYLGTIGFVIYFAHRYQISQQRAKVIRELDLEQKIRTDQPLTADDRAALDYVLTGLQSSKERWNYITIFVTSALALVYGLVTDLL